MFVCFVFNKTKLTYSAFWAETESFGYTTLKGKKERIKIKTLEKYMDACFFFFFNPCWLYAELLNGNPKGWKPHSHGAWVTPGERLTFRNRWEPERMERKRKPHLSDEDISCLVSLLQSILTYATLFASPNAPVRCAGQLLLTLPYRWKKTKTKQRPKGIQLQGGKTWTKFYEFCIPIHGLDLSSKWGSPLTSCFLFDSLLAL